MTQEEKRHWPKMGIFFGALAVVVTVAACVLAFYYRKDLADISHFGGYSLLGVLIIAFLAGSILSFVAIPVPYWLLVFTLPSVLAPEWGLLAPVAVGLTSALGTTLGHFPTFMLGYGGGKLSQKVTTKFNFSLYNRVYNRVMVWMQKHGAWAAFGMSAMFNPAHLPMTLAIGALHFPPPKFLLFSFLGNVVKSFFLAFCGYYGLTKLLPFIGVT